MARRSFYNIPDWWNPGFAEPANVEAEGLRRATFTTAWSPRGTFTPGAPASSNWATPKYIRRESQAGSARVTQWLPRGTYTGGRIVPRTQVARQAGAGGPGDPIQKYGQKAAAMLVAQVKMVPGPHRSRSMKAVLDKVDPTLWRRASVHAAKYRAKGHKAEAALQKGLARAMSEGMLTELVETGRRSSPPPRRSQIGLGCYGCAAALGDVLEELGATATTDHRNGKTPIKTHTAAPPKIDKTDLIQVGPFLFGAGGGRVRVHNPSVIPAGWKKFFAGELDRLAHWSKDKTNRHSAAEFGADQWFGVPLGHAVAAELMNGSTPIMKTKYPDGSHEMGIFLTATPTVLEVSYRAVTPAEKGFWGSLWNDIKSVSSKVIHAVGDFAKVAVKKLGDLACKAVNDPAAAGVAGVAGGSAGAVGVGIVQGLCTTDADDLTAADAGLPTLAPPSNLLPLAIAGGGALLAAIFLK